MPFVPSSESPFPWHDDPSTPLDSANLQADDQALINYIQSVITAYDAYAQTQFGGGGGGGSTTGATYYIAASGNDANAGTQLSPWHTVAKVNGLALKPGDTVLFNGGDSFTDAVLNIPTSGSTLGPIKFSTYGTGQATITQGFFCNKDWIWLDNLIFTTGSQLGSGVSTKSHWCVITGCSIILPGGNNTSIGLIGIGAHNYIGNSTISGAGDSGILCGVSNGGAPNSADSDDWTFENNVITNVGTNSALGFGAHGIYCKCTNARIYNNTITFFGDSAISLRYPNAIVRDNLIQYSLQTGAAGIGIGWFQYDTVAAGTTRIFNNQILDVPLPIYVSPSNAGVFTLESFVISRNTLRSQTVTKNVLFMDLAKTPGTYVVRDNTEYSAVINNAGVTNGSFESAIGAEWVTSGGFFISAGGALTQDASFATYPARGTTIPVDGGAHSGKVICSGANSNKGAEQQLALLGAGSYQATIWAKGNAGGELLQVVAASSGQQRINTFTATTTWTPYTVAFYSDGTNRANISVCTQAAANPTFFIDALQVAQ